MKLIERVVYSIIGKPIKSLLLGLVVFLLGTFMSASFSIYQANNDLLKEVKENLSPVILIDWQKNNYETEEFKNDFIEKLKENDLIKFIENRYTLYNDDIHLKVLSEDDKSILGFLYAVGVGNVSIPNPLPTLIGVDSYTISDIHNGVADMYSGRMFNEQEIDEGSNSLFIIYKEGTSDYILDLQKEIGLKIFLDELPLINLDDYESGPKYFKSDYSIDVNVIGSAKYNRDVRHDDAYHSYYSNTFSGLYVPSKFLDKLSEDIKQLYQEIAQEYPWYKEQYSYYFDHLGMKNIEETYIEINDFDQMKSFIKMIEKEGEGYIDGVYSFADSYSDVQMVANRLNVIAIVSLVVCSIASIILLSLIIQIFVLERRHEIGVFLSLGEKKKKVITQILCEVLIIGFLGITLSIFSGHVLSKSFSSDLLEKQIQQQEELYQDTSTDDGITQTELIDTYSVSITIEYILCVYAGGMFVLVISCIVPARSILKMKPKKLLM